MIDLKKLLAFQASKVESWHQSVELTASELPWTAIEENHQFNFLLWHEEDIARVKDIPFERIVEAKRNIDHYNQMRNNAMEKIDEWVLNYIRVNNVSEAVKMHSETPGMMIDRLSIMALKEYHTQEEVDRDDASSEHVEKCRIRVNTLQQQIGDLASCLEQVLNQIEAGQLKFKVYRQLKMYNDPSLNPQLYKRDTK